MADYVTLIGSFHDLEREADTLDELRSLGIPDRDITIVSSLPYSSKAMGRPQVRTLLPIIVLGSAVVGLLLGLFFTVVTPNLYVIRVGGQPVVPVPTTALLLYEFTMLVMILGTFIGFVALSNLPLTGPEYDGPAPSDDRINVCFRCPIEQEEPARLILTTLGAKDIHEFERRGP
jgi:hypothetical protein